MTKPVRCDAEILRTTRVELMEKTRPLWDVGADSPNQFCRIFGDGLHRVPDSKIVELALIELTRKIQQAPAGKTGLEWFDRPGMDEPWDPSREPESEA